MAEDERMMKALGNLKSLSDDILQDVIDGQASNNITKHLYDLTSNLYELAEVVIDKMVISPEAEEILQSARNAWSPEVQGKAQDKAKEILDQVFGTDEPVPLSPEEEEELSPDSSGMIPSDQTDFPELRQNLTVEPDTREHPELLSIKVETELPEVFQLRSPEGEKTSVVACGTRFPGGKVVIWWFADDELSIVDDDYLNGTPYDVDWFGED